MKTTSILPAMAIALLVLSACGGKTNTEPADEAEPTATAPAATEADSTLYGTSGEFGMSTFTLITDSGDTLSLTRDAADGSMAGIYGSLVVGQRYAITTRDSGNALGTAINLGQLERFVKDYALVNGRLVLARDGGTDTLTIVRLDDEGIDLSGKDGQELRLTAPQS